MVWAALLVSACLLAKAALDYDVPFAALGAPGLALTWILAAVLSPDRQGSSALVDWAVLLPV